MIDNFLTQDEVDWFNWYWTQLPCKINNGKRWGSCVYYDQGFFKNIREILDKKVAKDEYIVAVNISEDYEPGGIHTDGYIGDKSNEKNCLGTSYLIPLEISEQFYTLTFKSYSDRAVSLNKYFNLEGGVLTYDQVDKDYFNFGDKVFDNGLHQKYLGHLNYDLLKGIEVDKILPWDIGRAVTWPRPQLHVTAFFPKNITRRMILILTCKR